MKAMTLTRRFQHNWTAFYGRLRRRMCAAVADDAVNGAFAAMRRRRVDALVASMAYGG